MKTGLIALMFCFLQDVSAQYNIVMETIVSNQQKVTTVLNEYFKGIQLGDTSLLNSVFYENALLFGDINGEPYAKTVDEYLIGVANRISPSNSGQPFKAEILSVDIINSIAIAKLHVRMYTFNYYNFITLHEMDGKWLIVNKTLTNVNE